MKMKIQPTNLTEPLTAGNLLYDLVQMQQQDEEELHLSLIHISEPTRH